MYDQIIVAYRIVQSGDRKKNVAYFFLYKIFVLIIQKNNATCEISIQQQRNIFVGVFPVGAEVVFDKLITEPFSQVRPPFSR